MTNPNSNSHVIQSKGVKAMLIDESFETSVPPTSWTLASPDGGTGWNQQTDGTTPIPGWTGGTVTTPDGGGNAIAYCTWSTGGASSNDQWLISPQITVASGDMLVFETINFYAQYVDVMEVKLSTTDAATASFTIDLGTITWDGSGSGAGEWTEYSYDLSAYDGQSVYIAFREVIADNQVDGAAIGLDLVKVGSPAALDAGIVDIDLPPIFGTGLVDIMGTVQNFGTDNLVSFDVVYTIDGTDVSAVYSVNSIDIAYGETSTFTHDVQYDFTTAATYNVEVEISNINGGTDENLENNVLAIDVEAAEGVVPRRVLHEVLTSSSCAPCAATNPVIDGVVFNSANVPNSTVVKYQVSWPGDGDPYQTPMAADRVTYYGTEAVPDFWVDGNNDSGSSYTQAAFDNYFAIPSFFEIEGEHSIVGDQVDVDVTITPNADFSGVCQVVVIEKVTTENVSSNGETEFHNVAMAMLPTTAGTTVDLTAGTPYTFSVSKDMSDTFVEEMFDLEVVLFLQVPDTKEVMQSNYSVLNNPGSDLVVTDVEVVSDVVDCVYSDASEILVTLFNFGSDDITEFDVSYTVDGGDPVSETVTYTILAGEIYTYPFPTTVNLSSLGIHEIVVNASFAADIYTENNTATATAISADDLITVNIIFDDYPGETSWDLVDQSTGTVIAEGSGYSDETTLTQEICALSDACYTFTIYDAYSDGMCCSYGDGSYSVERGGVEVASGGSFADFESTDISISIDIELDDISICPGEAIIFQIPGMGVYDTDPGTMDNTTPGTTTVNYVIDEAGVCEVSESFDVIVLSDVLDIIDDDITICAGEEITFSVGDGVYDPASVDNMIVATTSVSYILNGGTACELTTTFDVIVKNNDIDIVLEDIYVCPGETIEYVIGGTGVFDVDASTIDNSTPATTTVIYTVAEGAMQCEVSETFDVIVVVATMDIAPEDITVCEGEEITFLIGTGVFDPASVANDVVGVTTVTYTVNEGMTCESSETFDVTVNEMPEAIIVLGSGYELSTTSDDAIQWYLDAVEIEDVTGQTYVCAVDGEYYAVMSNEFCTNQSNTITVTGTYAELIKNESINVFPNPANNKLFIEFENFSELSVIVMDCTGKVVISKEIISGEFVDVSDLATGVYFVNVKNSNNVGGMYKIVIE